MAAIATITINDGQATPVAHNFTPSSVMADLATWFDRSGGIAVGYPKITLQVRPPMPRATSRVYKVTAKIWAPTLEVTSPSTGTGIQPAPTKAYDCVAELAFTLPERSTKLNRQDIFAYVKNLLALTVVKTAVEDLENVY